MKTTDLTGLALDWAVANALPEPKNTLELLDRCIYNGFNPSTNWSQGGPIIEREEIDTLVEQRDLKTWAAEIYHSPKGYIRQRGPTPLIAAMRCYVASKMGDEVEIPEELK